MASSIRTRVTVSNGSGSGGSSAAPSRQFVQSDADAVYALAQEPSALGSKVKDALGIIDQALQKYGLEHVSLSFNGGKDCTVLVHLLAASALHSQSSIHSHSNSATSPPPRLECVYVRCSSPFPQVETFVDICAERYHLELEAVDGGMREALQIYLDRKKPIKAVLVGTRRHDPHGEHLTPFARTDGGWPDFMRVHPILDWSYVEIWQFLRHPDLTLGGSKETGTIEWCELYDYGYTSLGSTHNTFPNPLLKAIDDENVKGGWRPAWELEDETQERAGREVQVQQVLDKAGEDSRKWDGEIGTGGIGRQ